jgi:hypothetical protein
MRARDSGNWHEPTMSKDQLLQLLTAKIEMVSFDRIREDIVKFIPDPKAIEIWSSAYFTDLIKNIKFKG